MLDWHEAEFWSAWIRWRQLDIQNVVEAPTGNAYENGCWEPNPDLSNVEEFGLAGMLAGSGHEFVAAEKWTAAFTAHVLRPFRQTRVAASRYPRGDTLWIDRTNTAIPDAIHSERGGSNDRR